MAADQSPQSEMAQSWLSRVEELALMHFYTTATARTLARGKADQLVWREVVPLDAFAHNFVLDAIIALAALHKAHAEPSTSMRYTTASSFYQHRGLRDFTHYLDTLNGSNCHAFFAFSMMATVHAIAMSRGTLDTPPTPPFETLSLIYELLRGTGHLSKDILGPNSTNVYKNLISEEQRAFSRSNTMKPVPDDVAEALRSLYQHVNHLASAENGNHLSDLYNATINSLEMAFHISAQTSEPALGTIVAWPVRLDEEAVDLYRRGDDLMLLIFIHYGVLYLSLNDRWWAQGFGARMIRTLSDHLHSSNISWVQSTAWAIAKSVST